MPVDFFSSPCGKVGGNCNQPGIVCSSVIEADRFGLKDANANSREPAYYMVDNEESWDVIVRNPDVKKIIFKAVDYCVDIFRTGTYALDDDTRDPHYFASDNIADARGELIKRCEGFFFFENTVLLV